MTPLPQSLGLHYHLQSDIGPVRLTILLLGFHSEKTKLSSHWPSCLQSAFFTGDGEALPTTSNSFSPNPDYKLQNTERHFIHYDAYLIPPLNLCVVFHCGISSSCTKCSIAALTLQMKGWWALVSTFLAMAQIFFQGLFCLWFQTMSSVCYIWKKYSSCSQSKILILNHPWNIIIN